MTLRIFSFSALPIVLTCFTPALALADVFPPTQVCAAEDSQTCLILSPEVSQELIKGNNLYGDDILIRVSLVAKDQKETTLRSLRMTALRASSGQEITPFSFQHTVRLQLGHWFLFQRPVDAAGLGSPSFTRVDDVRQWLSVYWNNGQSMVRLNDAALDANEILSIPVNSLGQYQIRVAPAAGSFHLVSGSPYPRTLTPNGRYNHRAFFFFSTPGTDPVTGTIYDFQGAKVRELHLDSMSPSNSALVWDGRDEGGQVVPSGPYLYKISAGGESESGGLVVAR